MFIIIMTTIVGLQSTEMQLPTRYRTQVACKDAIISVAHQQVPPLNSMIAFRCVKEKRAI